MITPHSIDAFRTEPLVYIVDDDEALRDSLVWLLDSSGLKASPFASAEAFLKAWNDT